MLTEEFVVKLTLISWRFFYLFLLSLNASFAWGDGIGEQRPITGDYNAHPQCSSGFLKFEHFAEIAQSCIQEKFTGQLNAEATCNCFRKAYLYMPIQQKMADPQYTKAENKKYRERVKDLITKLWLNKMSKTMEEVYGLMAQDRVMSRNSEGQSNQIINHKLANCRALDVYKLNTKVLDNNPSCKARFLDSNNQVNRKELNAAIKNTFLGTHNLLDTLADKSAYARKDYERFLSQNKVGPNIADFFQMAIEKYPTMFTGNRHGGPTCLSRDEVQNIKAIEQLDTINNIFITRDGNKNGPSLYNDLKTLKQIMVGELSLPGVELKTLNNKPEEIFEQIYSFIKAKALQANALGGNCVERSYPTMLSVLQAQDPNICNTSEMNFQQGLLIQEIKKSTLLLEILKDQGTFFAFMERLEAIEKLPGKSNLIEELQNEADPYKRKTLSFQIMQNSFLTPQVTDNVYANINRSCENLFSEQLTSLLCLDPESEAQSDLERFNDLTDPHILSLMLPKDSKNSNDHYIHDAYFYCKQRQEKLELTVGGSALGGMNGMPYFSDVADIVSPPFEKDLLGTTNRSALFDDEDSATHFGKNYRQRNDEFCPTMKNQDPRHLWKNQDCASKQSKECDQIFNMILAQISRKEPEPPLPQATDGNYFAFEGAKERGLVPAPAIEFAYHLFTHGPGQLFAKNTNENVAHTTAASVDLTPEIMRQVRQAEIGINQIKKADTLTRAIDPNRVPVSFFRSSVAREDPIRTYFEQRADETVANAVVVHPKNNPPPVVAAVTNMVHEPVVAASPKTEKQKILVPTEIHEAENTPPRNPTLSDRGHNNFAPSTNQVSVQTLSTQTAPVAGAPMAGKETAAAPQVAAVDPKVVQLEGQVRTLQESLERLRSEQKKNKEALIEKEDEVKSDKNTAEMARIRKEVEEQGKKIEAQREELSRKETQLKAMQDQFEIRRGEGPVVAQIQGNYDGYNQYVPAPAAAAPQVARINNNLNNPEPGILSDRRAPASESIPLSNQIALGQAQNTNNIENKKAMAASGSVELLPSGLILVAGNEKRAVQTSADLRAYFAPEASKQEVLIGGKKVLKVEGKDSYHIYNEKNELGPELSFEKMVAEVSASSTPVEKVAIKKPASTTAPETTEKVAAPAAAPTERDPVRVDTLNDLWDRARAFGRKLLP